MTKWITAIAFVAAGTVPAVAQDTDDAVPDMTCGDFLALDAAGQMSAMLELRAVYAGEDVPQTEEAKAATAVTGATEEGAQGGIEEEAPPEAEGTPGARQRVAGMRTSCMGVPDVPAMDALVAAHADYEPVLESEQSDG
ncbi:HdeA/HdeB family protein [Palleronia aestuarii]|uniref:HdeA/HdeB family protein n=1 Tax=Palleronia aestuarii TaxID=568105 RepID=A0A2W7MWQ1_9RHOB|nr:hypothetical protein [Palleronia aestuarii]PZX12388.1 HdeA/HdeB family protein [Palleronia aestuarii]